MKSAHSAGLTVLLIFSCHAAQQPIQPTQPQEEPDYGPEILANFLKVIPGLLTMASGQKSENPEVAAAGFRQFAQGFSGFLGSLEKVINRKPRTFKKLQKTIILHESFFYKELEKELATEEGQQALRSWKRSLLQVDAVPATTDQDDNDDHDNSSDDSDENGE